MPRGGKRPGAGRPRKADVRAKARRTKPVKPAGAGTSDAKEFLERVVYGTVVPTAPQLEAAKALLPFQHRKLGEIGKKERRQDEAGKIGGRFRPAAPPNLSLVKSDRPQH